MDLQFETKEQFRSWLAENTDGAGVWLLFGKKGGPQTLTAGEALEEALCFGWIDGQMEKIDDTRYRKYFAPRRSDSPWSEKNRGIAEKLTAAGRMTEAGLARINEAKADGRWSVPKRQATTEEQVAALGELLRGHEPAAQNYSAMSPSARRQFAGFYFEAKSEEARARRLEKITGRLDQGLKLM